MAGRFGILGISVGIFLMTGTSSGLVGLGVWWFGVLLLLDSFLGGGLAAQFLWGFGTGVAVWGFSAGWAVSATEGVGQVVVAALSLLLALVTVVRMVRSPERPAPSGTSANDQLQRALSLWDAARDQASAGQRLRAGLTYQGGLNHLLRHVTLTKPDDLVPVYHAMSAMGREGLPLMDQLNATRPLRLHARLTLAAAHLADPVGGQPELITGALAAEAGSLPRLDLNGDGPLSAEARIAGAAEARLLLAGLMVDRPALRWAAEPPWLVGSGGQLSFARERRRFQQAVLPSCAGLSLDEETTLLARESVQMYTQLCRVVPGYESERERAERVLARSLP